MRRRAIADGLRSSEVFSEHEGDTREEPKNEKSRSKVASAFRRDPGGDLLSHTKNHAVPSALKSLTTEFGMGSGVTSSLRPPRITLSHLR